MRGFPRRCKGGFPLQRSSPTRDPVLVRAIGPRIEELRLQRGMSRRALATAAELDEKSLREIEGSEHKNGPRWDTVWKIADALGVPVAALANEPAAPAAKSDIVEVIGAAEFGEWSTEPEWPPGRRYSVGATRSRQYPKTRRFGLVLADGHCDRFYRAGSILLCLPLAELGRPLEEGDRVIARLHEAGRTLTLCMVVAPSPAGGVSLRTASKDSRLKLWAEIEKPTKNHRAAKEAGRSGYIHFGAGPAAIDYVPAAGDTIVIEAVVVGHAE